MRVLAAPRSPGSAALRALGIRSGAVLGPYAITWGRSLGARRTIPWARLRAVRVPGAGDPGTCVRLILADDSVCEVDAISKPRRVGPRSDRAWRHYLSAVQAVVDAHRASSAPPRNK